MSRKPIKLGITGSIGMGKTTVAREVEKQNYPVFSSDEVVHKLYEKDNLGYQMVKNLVPDVAIGTCVDRELLSKKLLEQPNLIKKIESVIHPIVTDMKEIFLLEHQDKPLVVFDIPLLFETKSESWLDCVIVVTAPISIQKKRVLSRSTMTEEHFYNILSKQLKNEEKVMKADFVINTDSDYKLMIIEIKRILKKILNDYN